MIKEIKNIASTKKDLRNFWFTIGSVLLVIALILFFKEKDSDVYFFSIGLAFILSGIVLSFILKPLYKIWMTFAVIIGWIMTRIILAILFFFIITAIGVLARLFGKDFLNLKPDHRDSFWNIRNIDRELNQDYEKQFWKRECNVKTINIKRILGLFIRKKKMVACTNHNFSISFWILDFLNWRNCSSTFYLYIVLKFLMVISTNFWKL